MLEHEQGEAAQVHARQAGVQRAQEVFVEPLCLFDLKADALDGFELFTREVDDEADTEVV